MNRVFIKGGKIVNSKESFVADILIEDEKISKVFKNGEVAKLDEDTKVVFQKGDAESITLENGLDVEDYFDQLMNQHFTAVPHIIRDEDDNLILVYGPMSLIVSLNEQGGLAVISIYIDTRDEEESVDEYGYIEEDLTESVEDEPFTDY